MLRRRIRLLQEKAVASVNPRLLPMDALGYIVAKTALLVKGNESDIYALQVDKFSNIDSQFTTSITAAEGYAPALFLKSHR